MVAPLTLAAAALTARRHPLGPLLVLGVGVYALYTCAQIIIGQEYLRLPGNVERYFPLLHTVFVAAEAVVVLAWRLAPPTPRPSLRLERTAAVVLLLVAAFLVFGQHLRPILTALLLVLGIDRDKKRAAHGALGPIEDRVAVHAHCPVVVVSRLPIARPKPTSDVGVGWIDAVSAWWAFNAAVAAADVRRASLTVLRVMPVNRQDDEPWAGDRPLLEAISDAQSVCPPSLYIRISHEVTDDTADALVRAADGADLLVVGCHHSDDRWSVRTGPVAEAVMRGASCPVMLVSQPVHALRGRQPAPRAGAKGARR